MDEARIDRAIHRMLRWVVALSVIGTAAASIYGGWRWGFGFLAGAVASYWNFRGIIGIADRLVQAAQKNAPRPRAGYRVVLRFLVLGIAAFVILKYSELNLTAAFAGLFVSVAAVILELLFELIYARA
jgi:hypothetical protein